MNKTQTRLTVVSAVATMALYMVVPAAADMRADTQAIETLIATYATAIDRADTNLADQLFSNAPEVTFIHPLGEEHGRGQIEANVFANLMGVTFSERKLTSKDIAVHVYVWRHSLVGVQLGLCGEGPEGWQRLSFARQGNTRLPS